MKGIKLTLSPQDQQLLLRDAHVTLLSTMDYLVIANLVSGKKDRAIQVGVDNFEASPA